MKTIKKLKILVIVLTITLSVISFVLGILRAINSSYEMIVLSIGIVVLIINFICWFVFAKLTSKQHPLLYKLTIFFFGFIICSFALALLLGAELKVLS